MHARQGESDLVGVLLTGRLREARLAAEACRFAGSRPRSMVVLVARPCLPVLFWMGAAEALLDPEDLARELELLRRGEIRSLLEASGLETKYSLSMVDRPRLISAVATAAREGCGVLFVPERRLGPQGQAARILARRTGVELLTVPSDPVGEDADATDLSPAEPPRPFRLGH